MVRRGRSCFPIARASVGTTSSRRWGISCGESACRCKPRLLTRRLVQLLLGPDPLGVQLDRLGKRLPGVRVLVLFAESKSEPKPGIGIFRVKLDRLAEI